MLVFSKCPSFHPSHSHFRNKGSFKSQKRVFNPFRKHHNIAISWRNHVAQTVTACLHYILTGIVSRKRFTRLLHFHFIWFCMKLLTLVASAIGKKKLCRGFTAFEFVKH